jgi:alcohol dehydrogenase
MYHFEFHMPTKILFGAGQLKQLHKEQMPGRKALIVTSNGQSTKKYGYLKAVEDELALAVCSTFSSTRCAPIPLATT